MVIDKLKTNDNIVTASSTYWTNYYSITDTLEAGVVTIDRLYIDSMVELKQDLFDVCCAADQILVSCNKEEVYIGGKKQKAYHLIVRQVTKPYITSIVYNNADYVKKNDWTLTCCNVPSDINVNNAVVEKTTRVTM